MWPMPRAPISNTRNLVSSVADRAMQRQPDLVVERARRPHRRRRALEHLGDEVLGAGLARGPGQRDQGRAEPSYDVTREGAECALDVLDDDGGHADGAGRQYGDRARFDDRAGEVVAVHALAREGDEEAARLHLAGVPGRPLR
ncbi:hypothetical protein SALBM311S_02223 [Streptomyces alboniger]